ncbi:TPA: tail fiber assembly protein [Kluyvera georgiana]
MTELFDVNGNAIETVTVTVYGFDQQTREYQATYNVRILAGTGIPGFSTMQAVPNSKAGYAFVWNGKAWLEVEDHRGEKAYEKATGDVVIIKELGSPDDKYTFLEPATPYDKWDGSAWVTDTDAQHAADVAAAEQTKQILLATARSTISIWQTELQLGSISEEDKSQLIAWLAYIKAVQAIDASTAPEINWPAPPEV